MLPGRLPLEAGLFVEFVVAKQPCKAELAVAFAGRIVAAELPPGTTIVLQLLSGFLANHLINHRLSFEHHSPSIYLVFANHFIKIHLTSDNHPPNNDMAL